MDWWRRRDVVSSDGQGENRTWNLEKNTEVESGALTLRLRAPRTPWTNCLLITTYFLDVIIWCRDLSLAVD